MADRPGRISAGRRSHGGSHGGSHGTTPIQIVAGLDVAGDQVVPTSLLSSRCQLELVETLFEWGVEPWEIALATGQSEASVEHALRHPRPLGPKATHRSRAAWVDDFLIFLHARLSDLPNWWGTAGIGPEPSEHSPNMPLRSHGKGAGKRARETRAL